MRPLPLLTVLALLAASFSLAVAPASASGPLQADAGVTQSSWDAVLLTLNGQARGGTAPYAYAWSYGDNSRFSNPAAAAPTFNVSGLATGNYTLTLTVTDAASATASDTVILRVEPTTSALNIATTTIVNVDDEAHGESLDSRSFTFSVPPRTGILRVRLGWTSPTADLDLALVDPFGGDPVPDQGHAGTNPETKNVANAFPGSWRAVVQPRSGDAGTPFTLQARVGNAKYVPEVFAMGPYEFGSSDAQELRPLARATVGPYSFEWDLDGDGWFETSGGNVTASLPVGVHTVTVRATDGNGFSAESSTTVTVRASDRVLKAVCGGDSGFPYWAMEYTASRGTCWIHGGHHTYYMRGTYAFDGMHGFAFSVEQEFAPSADVATNGTPSGHHGHSPLYVELSMDGVTWTDGGAAYYRYGQMNNLLEFRQVVWIDVEGHGQPFRFLRLRVPESVSQGLSGYLDHTDLRIAADELTTTTAVSAASTKAFDCQTDLMEDFIATHPCWFGGIDRYDSPSFFHTYVVGPGSSVTRVNGTFLLAPWRSDDFFSAHPISQVHQTHAFVQVSQNGIDWTDVATVPALYGVPASFDVTLDGTGITFVRLFPQYHARFDQHATFGPNHHPRAYFLDSQIAIEGTLREWT